MVASAPQIEKAMTHQRDNDQKMGIPAQFLSGPITELSSADQRMLRNVADRVSNHHVDQSS